MTQIRGAARITDVKYPREEGWRVVWIFDRSSCHAAMPEDALDALKMNVNPGGKQRVMRNGVWDGKPQKMNYALGVQKGMRVVLEERGVNTHGMNADRMCEVLSSHADFRNEKSRIERFLMEDKEHIVYMLPKFHCELNPIERVWAEAKRYSKAYRNLQNHFRKVRHYMFAYLKGVPGGSGLEKLVKDY